MVQVSDTHLSPRHAWAQPNFDAVVAWLAADPPDLVVHTGDAVLDDPDDLDDRVHARRQADRLPAPWVALPGNHDVGEVGGDELVTPARLAAWAEWWGSDRFRVDLGPWRLLGLNLFVLATGWAAEAEQADWTRQQLAGAEHVAVFLHKPLHLGDPGAEDPSWGCLTLAQRTALAAVVADAPVRVVASGHLHRFATSCLPWPRDATAVWAPATSFVGRDHGDGALRRVGVVEHRFSPDGGHAAAFVAPPGMRELVYADLLGGHQRARDAPPAPLDAGSPGPGASAPDTATVVAGTADFRQFESSDDTK